MLYIEDMSYRVRILQLWQDLAVFFKGRQGISHVVQFTRTCLDGGVSYLREAFVLRNRSTLLPTRTWFQALPVTLSRRHLAIYTGASITGVVVTKDCICNRRWRLSVVVAVCRPGYFLCDSWSGLRAKFNIRKSDVCVSINS